MRLIQTQFGELHHALSSHRKEIRQMSVIKEYATALRRLIYFLIKCKTVGVGDNIKLIRHTSNDPHNLG